jgi:polysaccharide pyruvyl transferase WcaK-like protein
LLAHAAGRTLIVEGVGVDAGMTGVNRRLVVRLLGKADQVTVRDRTSARVLAEWGVAALVGDDLSARMPSAPPRAGRELLRTSGVDGRSPVVGLCLTAVNPQIAPAVADAVAELMRLRPEWQFCFVPMSQHPFVEPHNDLLLARSLQVRSPRLKVVEGAHHPGAILSLFGALDAVVAMRYHALLFAERSGTPLVAVPYAEKDEGWLADHGRRAVAPSGRALSRALLGSMPARSKAS